MNPRVEYQKQTGKSAYRYETEDGRQSGETHEYVAWLEKQYLILTGDESPKPEQHYYPEYLVDRHDERIK